MPYRQSIPRWDHIEIIQCTHTFHQLHCTRLAMLMQLPCHTLVARNNQGAVLKGHEQRILSSHTPP